MSARREYVAELCWYDKARPEFGYRNKTDGHYESIRTILRGTSIQEVVDTAVQARHTKDGSKYPFVDLTVTSSCARCKGYGNVAKLPRRFNFKKCPDCKGNEAKRQEFTIRI